MTNQTFEDKVGATILAYGARAAMQNGRGSTTPAQDYRDAVQSIIKLIEEEVIGEDITVSSDNPISKAGEKLYNQILKEQRERLKGDK